MNNELIELIAYNPVFNDILGLHIPNKKIYYSKGGLIAHLKKSNHQNCLQYVQRLLEMIQAPDYIGVNPKETGQSIELVKVFDENILVGIKFDEGKDYLYVASIYDIQQSKLERRIHSGRLKKYTPPVDKR